MPLSPPRRRAPESVRADGAEATHSTDSDLEGGGSVDGATASGADRVMVARRRSSTSTPASNLSRTPQELDQALTPLTDQVPMTAAAAGTAG